MANFGGGDVSMYAIDSSTGLLSPLPLGASVAAGTGPVTIAVDPSGAFAYVANFSSSNLSVFTVDLTTGVLSPATPATVPAGTSPNSVIVTGTVH